MASSLRRESSSFGKKALFFLFLIAAFVYLPVYISVYEVNQSRKSFSTVSLVDQINIEDGENVIKRFAAYGYNLDEIRKGKSNVPNLFLKKLPRELTKLEDLKDKKRLFIESLLPPILKVNQFIRYERSRLIEIMKSIELNGDASLDERYWLRRKMIRYRMDEFDINELYTRMNIIPPSLALAQAAIETGWGTSRFAQDANALYGQWTWNDEKGMIPLEREHGESHSIRKFNSLISAVESYALNLNTHPAYKDFRMERNKFPSSDQIKVNEDLLFTLLYYSELGFEYIDNLNNIMGSNNMRAFDKARLQKTPYEELRVTPET